MDVVPVEVDDDEGKVSGSKPCAALKAVQSLGKHLLVAGGSTECFAERLALVLSRTRCACFSSSTVARAFRFDAFVRGPYVLASETWLYFSSPTFGGALQSCRLALGQLFNPQAAELPRFGEAGRSLPHRSPSATIRRQYARRDAALAPECGPAFGRSGELALAA